MPPPAPIRPRRGDENRFNRALRRLVLTPMFERFRENLRNAASALDAVIALDAEPRPIDDSLVERETRVHAERLRVYHRRRLITTFNQALGIDVRQLLAEPPVQAFMNQRVAESVDLIKTIPRRSHADLRDRLLNLLTEAPFDRKQIDAALRDEFRSSGFKLRRISRDQTSKAIGGLTEIRQRQLRIEEYFWRTSMDEKVRPTHVANNGRRFRWDSPPPLTGHPGWDIQCRCVAQAADIPYASAVSGRSNFG